jgi:PAS domain-containing protein
VAQGILTDRSDAAAPQPAGEADAHDSEANAVRVQQFVGLVRVTPLTAGTNVVNSLLTIGLFWERVPLPLLLGWEALILGLTCSWMLGWIRQRDRPVPARVRPGTLTTATLTTAALGLLWGMAGWLFFQPDSILHQAFLIFVVGGMTAGAVGAVYLLPVACVTYILLGQLPVIVCIAAVGDRVHLIMAFMAVVYTAMMLLFVRHNYRVFRRWIRTDLDRLTLQRALASTHMRLVDAFKHGPAAMAYFDGDDRLVLCNDAYQDQFLAGDDGPAAPGTPYAELLQRFAALNLSRDSGWTAEAWVHTRQARPGPSGDR